MDYRIFHFLASATFSYEFLIYGILVGLITPILSLLLEVIDLSSSIYYLGGLYYLTLFMTRNEMSHREQYTKHSSVTYQ